MRGGFHVIEEEIQDVDDRIPAEIEIVQDANAALQIALVVCV
jgi:hypothetical protein